AEEAAPGLTGPEQRAWLGRLAAEHDNLRATLRWSLERGEGETALRLAAALWRFWLRHGHLTEGRRWLNEALAHTARIRQAARVRALSGAGVLAHYQGDFDRAQALCGEARDLARELGDSAGVAAATHGLAQVARWRGDYAAARAMYQESLAIVRELGDRWGTAHTLVYLGATIYTQGEERPGDFATTRPLWEEALAISRDLGDRH